MPSQQQRHCRSEKRNDDQNVRARLKMRKCRDALTQNGGAVDPGDERGETATLEPGRPREPPWVARTRTVSAQLRDARRCERRIPESHRCARNGGKWARKPMMGHKKRYIPSSFIRKKGETFGCLECKGIPSRHASERRKKLGRGAQPEMMQRVHQTTGTNRSADYLSFLAEAERRAVDSDQCLDMDDSDVDDFGVIPDRDAAVLSGPRVHLEDNPTSSSAVRERETELAQSLIRCPESYHSLMLKWGRCRCRCQKMRWRWTQTLRVVPASVRRVQREPVRLWAERADQTDMEVCSDTTDECCDCDPT